MDFEKIVERINELARKNKTVGLTSEEMAERDALRRQYIDGFKRSLKQQLDNIEIVDEDDGHENPPIKH
ncbi:DUF896 family protein [Paenibacillus selenitireducens]|jgi:uncharacterized protein YnzC (UPF0291/DUF896 family)|uniref:UPF0291 protein BVG16_23215 n=1 Tax=Paenibacillus selenitireducens TaxID=1324314 RepID=A0A1T2X443_9BACL|nr:DUF896 domain-containing protein [Paenibacillus selenitireducens]OPA74671.1 DUF896 family protein [Paenibacillus selenitireducens]